MPQRHMHIVVVMESGTLASLVTSEVLPVKRRRRAWLVAAMSAFVFAAFLLWYLLAGG